MRQCLTQCRGNAPAALPPRGGHGKLHTPGHQSHNLERYQQIEASAPSWNIVQVATMGQRARWVYQTLFVLFLFRNASNDLVAQFLERKEGNSIAFTRQYVVLKVILTWSTRSPSIPTRWTMRANGHIRPETVKTLEIRIRTVHAHANLCGIRNPPERAKTWEFTLIQG